MMVERDPLGFDAPAPVGHPRRAGLPDRHSNGPHVGDKLPDFVLPDVFGQEIDFHGSYQIRDSPLGHDRCGA